MIQIILRKERIILHKERIKVSMVTTCQHQRKRHTKMGPNEFHRIQFYNTLNNELNPQCFVVQKNIILSWQKTDWDIRFTNFVGRKNKGSALLRALSRETACTSCGHPTRERNPRYGEKEILRKKHGSGSHSQGSISSNKKRNDKKILLQKETSKSS